MAQAGEGAQRQQQGAASGEGDAAKTPLVAPWSALVRGLTDALDVVTPVKCIYLYVMCFPIEGGRGEGWHRERHT